MRIALIPLDERPVNLQLPRQVAMIAGHELVTPPERLLPHFREAGDADALADWLEQVAVDCDAFVVCLDTLAFGGLIAARTSDDVLSAVIARIDVLDRVAAMHPRLRIYAVSLVMRASDSYSSTEEPDYWSDYGRDLHRLGADLHRLLEFAAEGAETGSAGAPSAIPADVRSDFERRRLRNHVVNLAGMSLVAAGTIEYLAITADDTAPLSAGSAEQLWLGHWLRALPLAEDRAQMYPGADEVGAQLVARALTASAGTPRWHVVCPEPGGLDRIANFENVPLSTSVLRQIHAAGGVVVDSAEPADITLVVHAADPGRGDRFGGGTVSDPDAVERVVDAVRDALARGAVVALADLRFSNGADPLLMERLAAAGILLRLAAYGGWNTAGNALGGAVASASAYWAGLRAGSLDLDAVRIALLTRLLDDWVFQSEIRPRLQATVFQGSIAPVPPEVCAQASRLIEAELGGRLREIAPSSGVRVGSVGLPWSRSFEIAVELVPAGTSGAAGER